MSQTASDERALAAVHYPESDGEPMAETPVHGKALSHLAAALEHCFRDDGDVYVGANMFFYHQEGNPRARRAPDVFVVEGVAKTPERRVYKLWEEGRVPQLVIEVTSKSTQREDLWAKRALYEKLGVAEYLLFDPEGEYLEPRFQAHCLVEGEGYQPVTLAEDESFTSPALCVGFRPEGELLRVLDRDGLLVPHFEEAIRQAEEEARRADQAARQTEEANRRAEEAIRQTEEANRRAEEAERELERLRVAGRPCPDSGTP